MAVAKKMWVSAIAGVLATGFTVGLIGQRLQAQEIIIDPSVPGLNSTTLHSSGGGKPQIDIATPDSGVSHNKFQKYNVGPGGLILNNSATGGTSVIGGSVNANSNLATSGSASVILNEVTDTGTSSLTGITEIFGGKASVIIANPNGVGCNGCSFINTNRSTLTTGVPTVTGSQIDLLATRGTVSVGSGGFTSEGDADLIGRHVTIGGPVNADTTLTISGGAQSFNYNAGTSQAAPTTNAQQSPFAVDATSLGALTAGNIRIHGNEVGLGVNAYGNINAAGNLNLSSKGNIHYGNIQSTGTGQIDGQGSVRQYGNAQFDGNVTVSGNDFTLYRDRTLSAGGDVTINTDDFAVVIGEISGTNVNINVDGKFTNNGFVFADQELVVIAGEEVRNQREVATEYDSYFDPALRQYIEAYQQQVLDGGETAAFAAAMLARAEEAEILDQYVLKGATFGATNIDVTANLDLVNKGGAIAATNNITLASLTGSIINEYQTTSHRIDEDEDVGCPTTSCGYRSEFHMGEILAGGDLTLTAALDVKNLGSDMAAAGSVNIGAGRDVINALTSEGYIVDGAKTFIVEGHFPGGYVRECRDTKHGQSCSDVWQEAYDYTTSETYNSHEQEFALAPSRIATLNGDITIVAGRDFSSIGSRISAGGDLSVGAGNDALFTSFSGLEDDYLFRDEEETYTSSNCGKEQSTCTRTRTIEVVINDYKLVTALSDLIARNVTVNANRDIAISGARFLAQADLSLNAATGSVLIDSAHLPEGAVLADYDPETAGRFVELGQIFAQGSSLAFDASATTTSYTDDVYRLYQTVLGREADLGGLINWVGQVNGGTSKEDVADGLLTSTEFSTAFGTLDNTQFVTQLYSNAFDRIPDAGELAYWVDQLDAATATRRQVALGIADSDEAITATQTALYAFTSANAAKATILGDTDTGNAYSAYIANADLLNAVSYLKASTAADVRGALRSVGAQSFENGLRDVTSAVITVSGGSGNAWSGDSTQPVLWDANNSGSQWWKADFGSGNEKKILQYSIKTLQDWRGKPKEWKLQASDDGSNWTTIDEQSDEKSWSWYETRVYTIANPGKYRYYRLKDIKTISGDKDELEIANIELLEPTFVAEPNSSGDLYRPIPQTIGFSTKDGEGHDELNWNSVGAWGSANSGAAWDPDGNGDDDYESRQSGYHWIEVFYGSQAQTITSYSIKSSEQNHWTDAPKRWELRAVDADGNFVTLDIVENQTGWGANQVRNFTIDNPGSYTRYQLVGVSGQDPSSNWVRIRDFALRTDVEIPVDQTQVVVGDVTPGIKSAGLALAGENASRLAGLADGNRSLIADTDWRFATDGGLAGLSLTNRSVVYGGGNVAVNADLDIYLAGSTTVSSGDDLSLVAGRRIGALAAENSEFRLNDTAYDSFTAIGERLQEGTLLRDAYAVEADELSEEQLEELVDDGSIAFQTATANYTLAPLTVISGGGLTLSAGEDVLNFAGSFASGDELIVTAGRDIRNEALRNNFTLTEEDGCVSRACGGQGHDYKAGEFLSGNTALLSAGRDIRVYGGVVSAAASILAQAEGDIEADAITSQFLYYYTKSSSFFGLNKKKKKLYRAIIQEGEFSTEFGDISLIAGTDLNITGSRVLAGGDVYLEAGNDINLLAKSEEVHNYYKKSGFGFFYYASDTVRYNEFETALAEIQGQNVAAYAGNNLTGMGAAVFAADDIALSAENDVNFDAHQNVRYVVQSGWSLGVQFAGSNILKAAFENNGDALTVLEAYIGDNQAVAAVHHLATSKGSWDTLNGLIGAGYAAARFGADINFDARGADDTIASAFARKLNPFSELGELSLDPTSQAFLNGITFRLGAYESREQWTESYISSVAAGRDLTIGAGRDLVLAGGTVASAGRDNTLVAGNDLLITALADWQKSSSSSWGVSLGFNTGGWTIGADYAQSQASAQLYTNAAVTSGRVLTMVSGRDTIIAGADIRAGMTPEKVRPQPVVVTVSAGEGQALDYNDSNTDIWTTGVSGTHWWQADYGVDAAPTIVSYSVTAGQTNGDSDAPREWVLQGSNDEGSWTDLATVSGETGWNSGETRAYSVTTPGTYRYYRLADVKAQNPNSNWVRIAKLDLRTADDASEDYNGEIYMDAGRDLVVASKQNTAESNSFGFAFSISTSGAFSLSGNLAYADRRYTDTPTIIEAEDRLDIYVEGKTYLLGSALNSKTGNLRLDTGDFLFDNYQDSDTQTTVSAGVDVGATHGWNSWDANLGVSYSDKQGITFATVGQGDIHIRNSAEQNITALNRTMADMQRVTSKTDFAIEIPGLNFAKLAADIEATANLLRAIGADIPQSVRIQGKQAVDLYEDGILRGLSNDQIREFSSSAEFRKIVEMRKTWERAVEVFGSEGQIPSQLLNVILTTEDTITIDDDGRAFVDITCGTAGPCGKLEILLDQGSLTKETLQVLLNDAYAALQGAVDAGSTLTADQRFKLTVQCVLNWHIEGGSLQESFDLISLDKANFVSSAVSIGYDEFRLSTSIDAIDARLKGDTVTLQQIRDQLAVLSTEAYENNDYGNHAALNLLADQVGQLSIGGNAEPNSDPLPITRIQGAILQDMLLRVSHENEAISSTAVIASAGMATSLGGTWAVRSGIATNAPSRVIANVDDLSAIRNNYGLSGANTVAAAKTDIPGLRGQTFEGLSPTLRNQAGLDSLDDLYGVARPIKSPNPNPIASRHAEEDVLNSIAKQIDNLGLSPAQLDGRTISVHISNAGGICSTCYQGLGRSTATAGVIKQFSERYPGVNIRVTAEGGTVRPGVNSITVRGGKIVE